MPIPSPFHSRTSVLNESQEWRNWSGYLAAACYEPHHEREYYAIRNSAALIDVSPLFKYDFIGDEAIMAVNKIVTRDMTRCAVGQIMYSPWCDDHGHIIDDGTVWRLGENHFRITSADPSLRWFQDCSFGISVKVADVSRNLAALALQGPNSRKILFELIPDVDIDHLAYYHLIRSVATGYSITVTRTGYTGDLGYELWVAPQFAEQLWDDVVEIGELYGLLPVGMLALDIARIEAGLLLIDVDYISAQRAILESRKSTPFEVGLGWTVSLDKGPFVGHKALAYEKQAGWEWSLVGLEIDWQALERLFADQDLPPLVAGKASRDAVPVYNRQGRQVGQVTSHAFSPILKRFIALATIETSLAVIGNEVLVEITVEFTRHQCPAKVVKTPFYDPAQKRE